MDLKHSFYVDDKDLCSYTTKKLLLVSATGSFLTNLQEEVY